MTTTGVAGGAAGVEEEKRPDQDVGLGLVTWGSEEEGAGAGEGEGFG